MTITQELKDTLISSIEDHLQTLLSPGHAAVSERMERLVDVKNQYQDIELSPGEIFTLMTFVPELFSDPEVMRPRIGELLMNPIVNAVANMFYQYGYFSAIDDAEVPVPLEKWVERSVK
jgi:hypothetical protein